MVKHRRAANAASTADIYPSRETLLAILDAMFDELYVLDANNAAAEVDAIRRDFEPPLLAWFGESA